jgi:L-malate glycosyltransferase
MQLASGDLWAGAEAVIFELCKGLSCIDEIQLLAVFLNSSKLSGECLSYGINTIVIEEASSTTIQLLSKILNIFRAFKPHIIHSHRYKENLMAAISCAPAGFSKLVTTVHGLPETGYSLKTKTIMSINSLIINHLFSAVIAVSDDIMFRFAKVIGSDNKLTRIYNGIEIPNIRHRISKEFVIGSAGRLVTIKDYSFMIEIAKLICKSKPSVRFVLAGDGPERVMLNEKINRYGLSEFISLYGHIEDMDTFYNSIDLYLNTSHHEGIPVTILEAMVRGIPVVAPSVGGIPEIISDESVGVLVKERSTKAFYDAILKIVNSPVVAEDIGFAGRKHVIDHFSNSSMTSAYYHLYKKLQPQ